MVSKISRTRAVKSLAKKVLGNRNTSFILRCLKIIKINFYKILMYLIYRSQIKLASYECRKLLFLDEAIPIACLDRSEFGVNKSPGYINGGGGVLRRRVPEVNLYRLDNCFFKIDSSNFLSGGDLYVERIKDIPLQISDYSSGFLRWHDETIGLIRKSKSQNKLNFESAYFLGGSGSWNYYHWMTEILPKLNYIATQSGYNRCHDLVVSSEVKVTDAFRKTINAAIEGFDFKIHFLGSDELFYIDSLFVLNNPSSVLFNSKTERPDITFSYFRKKSLYYVRSIGEKLVNRSIGRQKVDKVFIARKEGAARPYNQDEVEYILVKEFGFEVVYFEDMPIEEQIKIFSSAKFVVGPSGAAWANIIFCHKDAKLLSWLPSNAKEFSVYSSLAYNLGLEMVFLEVAPDVAGKLHTSYKVPDKYLRECVTSLINSD